MAEMAKFALRLPQEVYDDLRAIADESRRSVNGQIVYVLERYIEDWKRTTEEAEGKSEAAA